MLVHSLTAEAQDVAPLKLSYSLEFRQCHGLQNCQPAYHHGMDKTSHVRISQHGEQYFISLRRS